ncbi:MAG: hypothetical protein JSR59_12025 [Proteobacteria bacterium]|nr:hypothetical protein [Pseudomonadota bacterium]
MEHIITISVELDVEQAWALAQFLKRIGWSDCRSLAEDDAQTRLMLEALEQVRQALADNGCAPREARRRAPVAHLGLKASTSPRQHRYPRGHAQGKNASQQKNRIEGSVSGRSCRLNPCCVWRIRCRYDEVVPGRVQYLFNCVAHECWEQGALGALQAAGGGITVATGATICSTTGLGCLAGGPMIAFGASDAWQGGTKVVDAFNGLTSEGFNPLKTGFTSLMPDWGATAYDGLSLGANLYSLTAKVPLFVGATDGITRTGSLFGLDVSRWDSTKAFLGAVNGQVGQLVNRITLTGSALWKTYGLGKDISAAGSP